MNNFRVVVTTVVLIETLWNVNRVLQTGTQLLDEVLIETLWNVNFRIKLRTFFLSQVLIETLWNVNVSATVAIS